MANGNITQTGLTNDPPTGLEEIVVPEPPTEGYRNPFTKQIMAGRTVPSREEIKIINTWSETRDPRYEKAAMELAKKYGFKYSKKKKGTELVSMSYDEIAKQSGVGLPELDKYVANNPAFDMSQRNTMALGNAANMTEAFNLRVPDLVEASRGNFDKFMENKTLQRYSGQLDANNPDARNALDITNKAIQEYQTDPENYFNQPVETNVDLSYKSSEKRNG